MACHDIWVGVGQLAVVSWGMSLFMVSVGVPQSVTTTRIRAAFDAAMGVGPADGVVIEWVGTRPRVATDAIYGRAAAWLLSVPGLAGEAAQRVANEVAGAVQEQLGSGARAAYAVPVAAPLESDMRLAWEDGSALTGSEAVPDPFASTGGPTASTGGSGGRSAPRPTTITTVGSSGSSTTAVGVALLAGFGVYAVFTAWRAWHAPRAPASKPRASRRGRGARRGSRR